MANPIIFIPGIEATTLVNVNTFNFNNVWDNFDTIPKSVGTPVFTYALQSDPRYDVDSTTIIRNGHIDNFPYAEAIPAIQQKTGAPMFLFGYDWRKSNMENGKRLLEFVAYLKGKLNSKSAMPVTKFDFITHSMGGLVFTCYLKQLNNVYDDLGRVAMCAPPFRGSVYPLVHLAIGNAGVNSVFSASDASRKANRTFPSIFELTSWYKDAVHFAANGQEADLLAIDNWQSNIYDDDKALFQSRLDLLKEYRSNGAMDLSQLPDAVKSNMVIIAGEDGKTLNKVLVQSKAPVGTVTNFFDFNQPAGDGDGTVPIESSTFYRESILTVAVKKSGWKIPDDLSFHGLFLKDGRVQNIVTKFLTGNLDKKNGVEWWSSIAGTERIA